MIVDPSINYYLTDVTSCLCQWLGARFVGSYLHGSLTMNAFQPAKSDIDVVATVKRPLAPAAVDELHNQLASLPLPGAAGGLDLNVLSLGSARHLTERSCWEATIRVARAASGQAVRIGDRCDPMLFIDVALLRQAGIALAGPSIEESFAPVAPRLILQACAKNCRVWAGRDIFHDPVSGVLTVCRAWCYLAQGALVSKPEAGEWAKTQLADSALVDAALAKRRGEPAPPLADAEVKAFCQRVYQRFADQGFQ